MSHIDMLSQFPLTFSKEPIALNHTFPSTRCFFFESIKLHWKGLWKSECICGPAVASVKDLSHLLYILSRIQTSRYDGQDTLRIHYLGKICCVQLFVGVLACIYGNLVVASWLLLPSFLSWTKLVF